MKKNTRIAALAMSLLMCMAFVAGCNLVETKEENKEPVAATVNGEEITVREVASMMEYYASNYYYQTYMTGNPVDITQNAEQMALLRTNIVESLIVQKLVRAKALELGYDKLSDEDRATVDAQFESDFAAFREDFREQAESDKLNDDSIDVEARIDELAKAALVENGSSYDETYNEYVTSMAMSNLQKDEYAKVTVTDADVKAYYDELLAAQTAEMTETPSVFEYYNMGYYSDPCVYAPEGYRYVNHILVGFDDESEAGVRIAEIETRLGEIVEKLATLNETDNLTEMAALKAEQADLNAEYETVYAEYRQPALDTAKSIIEQLNNGADWDTLSAQYNTDPGSMPGGDYAETGYLMSAETTSYVQSFTDAGMKLTTVGEYTKQPVESVHGFHIIKLVSEVTPGAVPFETIADQLKDAALTDKQASAWAAMEEELMAAANIVRNEDVISGITVSLY